VAHYSSKLRSEQAAATRSRVFAAAGTQFAESGYTATTLRSIAEQAGVSIETVQATGAKRALLMAAFDQIFTGEEDEKHFSERQGVAEILGDPDIEQAVRNLARWIADGNTRISPLWRIITAAAANDPEIAEYHREHLARMRKQAAEIITNLQSRDLIDPPRPVGQTADLVWHAQLPDARLRLVVDAGWSHEAYADWLEETFVDLCRPRRR
jgi:AcrR family transcriptional regulator